MKTFLFIILPAVLLTAVLTGCQLLPVPVNPNSSSSGSSASSGKKYSITTIAVGNGTIDPSGTIEVNEAGTRGFSFTPGTGYKIYAVYINETNQGPISSFTFTNVSTNHTITAIYILNSYNIIISNTVNAANGYWGNYSVSIYGYVNSKRAVIRKNSDSSFNGDPSVGASYSGVTINDSFTMTGSANITTITYPLSYPPVTNTSDYNCSAAVSMADYLANPSAYVNAAYAYPGTYNPFTLYGAYSILLQ